MIVSCKHCPFKLLVDDDPEEFELYLGQVEELEERYKCPQCKGVLSFGPGASSGDSMNAHDAHLTLMGMGFPDERVCSAPIVRALFKQQGIIVEAVDIPDTERCIIKSFAFEDGTILDISSGGYGPTAHRIRRPHGQEDRAPLQEAEGGSEGGVPVPGEADGS